MEDKKQGWKGENRGEHREGSARVDRKVQRRKRKVRRMERINRGKIRHWWMITTDTHGTPISIDPQEVEAPQPPHVLGQMSFLLPAYFVDGSEDKGEKREKGSA